MQCSLCGADVVNGSCSVCGTEHSSEPAATSSAATRSSDPAADGQGGRSDALEGSGSDGAHGAGKFAFAGLTSTQRVGALLAVGVLAAAGIFAFMRFGDKGGSDTDISGAGSVSDTSSGAAGPATQVTVTATIETGTEATPSTEPEPTPVDPLRGPEQVVGDASVMIEQAASGTGCAPGGGATIEGYPVALCDTWQESRGLVNQGLLAKGPILVVCQANLEVENPHYTANQANTYWGWLAGNDGVYDWFPLTAFKQGATNEPISGIAHCVR